MSRVDLRHGMGVVSVLIEEPVIRTRPDGSRYAGVEMTPERATALRDDLTRRINEVNE